MEAKKLRKYFLSGSFGLCIGALIATVVSAFFTLLFGFSGRIPVIFPIILIIGIIVLFSTLKNTIKTFILLRKLKRNTSLNDVSYSLSNTNNISYNRNEIIISDYYLFLKNEVAIIPYQQLTKIYSKYIRNDKREVTGIRLYCNTTKKRKITIFPCSKDRYELLSFIENIKQKNSNIEVNIESQ